MMILGLAALTSTALASTNMASTALIDGDFDYRIEIVYQEKNGLRTRTVKLRDTFDLSQGQFVLEDEDVGNAPLVIGELDTDGRVVTARMQVCRMGSNPCDEIAAPIVSFNKGSRRTVKGQTREGIYFRISFRP